MSVIEKIPGEWICTAEEYHAECEHVSHSALEVFRKSRRLYHGRYVAATIEPPEPTPSMRLGTLFHLAILESERFEANVVSAPECDRRTKEGKSTWAAFCEESAGKLVASAQDMSLCRSMQAAVQANGIASDFLRTPGKSEHSIVWQENETGLACKSRRDRVLDGLLIDLKTCRDASPEGFAKSAATFGYDRQAAWYLDGEKIVAGKEARFLFIAVSTEPPHEVGMYELNPDDVADARVQNRKSLFQLADCLQYDEWMGPHEKQVTLLSLPRWTKYQSEYEVGE